MTLAHTDSLDSIHKTLYGLQGEHYKAVQTLWGLFKFTEQVCEAYEYPTTVFWDKYNQLRASWYWDGYYHTVTHTVLIDHDGRTQFQMAHDSSDVPHYDYTALPKPPTARVKLDNQEYIVYEKSTLVTDVLLDYWYADHPRGVLTATSVLKFIQTFGPTHLPVNVSTEYGSKPEYAAIRIEWQLDEPVPSVKKHLFMRCGEDGTLSFMSYVTDYVQRKESSSSEFWYPPRPDPLTEIVLGGRLYGLVVRP